MKGQSFKSIAQALAELRSPEAVEDMLGCAPDSLADAFRSGALVGSGWYPVQWYSALHRAAAQATGSGVELSEALSARAVRNNFTGVYRAFALIISPEAIALRAPRAFRLFFSSGAAIVHEARAGFVDAEFYDCNGFDPYIWADAIGASKSMIACGGGRDVVHEVRSGGGTESRLRIAMSWSSGSTITASMPMTPR